MEIKLFKPIDKCKEFSGILESFDADTVTITEEGTPRTFARADIALIRLALDFDNKKKPYTKKKAKAGMEEMMNKELMEALDILEKEKEISKETLFEAIENSLMTACKNHFGKADNVHVEINRETCDFLVYAEKEVVPTKDDVEDDCYRLLLEDAQEIYQKAQVGDMIHVEIKSKEFGRIATQNAKNVILQKIREEERSVIYNQYYEKEKDVVTGVVQRYVGKNISINLR